MSVGFDLPAIAARYLNGEGLRQLAKECGIGTGTLHRRLQHAGYQISKDQRFIRQQVRGFVKEGIFSWSLDDEQYERQRQRDFDRAEKLWSLHLAEHSFENAITPAMCGRLPRLETCVLSQASLADVEIRASVGHRVKGRGLAR